MARYQCLEEDDYTDFELERQILASEYKPYKARHTEERRRYDREKYNDRYKERETDKDGRKSRQRDKYREHRDTRASLDKYLPQGVTRETEWMRNEQPKKRESKGSNYFGDYKRRERKREGAAMKQRKEQERERLYELKGNQTPKKKVTLQERGFKHRLCHSDSELDLVFTSANPKSCDLRQEALGKVISRRRGRLDDDDQEKEVRKRGSSDKSKQRQRKYYAEKRGKNNYEQSSMKKCRTKSSPELRESSLEQCLDSSHDSALKSILLNGGEGQCSNGLNTPEGRKAESELQPYPRQNGFRAKMFQLLIQHVKDLTKEVQEHKEDKKKMSAQIFVLEEETKALQERLKQPRSLAFKKRQTKKLDETFSALKEGQPSFSKNPSFKRDLRNILAEVQGKYCAQLREHELRIQEVQEKAENDIQDLMKNIVDKYVKVTEIKERQQQIEKLVASKNNETIKDGKDNEMITNTKLKEITETRLDALAEKEITNDTAKTDTNSSTADREKPYQFYFPENRIRIRENYHVTERTKSDTNELKKSNPQGLGFASSDNGKCSPTSKKATSPPSASRSSPINTNSYQYWHSRLTQGVKGKTTTLRNAT